MGYVGRKVGLGFTVGTEGLEFGTGELVNLGFALFPSCVDGVGCASTADGVELDGQRSRWVGGLGGMGWGVILRSRWVRGLGGMGWGGMLGGKGAEGWG